VDASLRWHDKQEEPSNEPEKKRIYCMDILTYFEQALQLNLSPLLLEFTHPEKASPLLICGINPSHTLSVREGKLYKNRQEIGDALEIFQHLDIKKGPGFFPAYLGYFAYEFARYFDKPCSKKVGPFPDAYFCLYEQGLVLDDNHIVHHTPLPSIDLKPKANIRAEQTLKPLLTAEKFSDVVTSIKDKIKDGDVYQVNFSLPFAFAAHQDDILPLYHAMRKTNPSPFMGIVAHDDGFVLSGSPERLFSLKDQKIATRPIAGTKRRGLTLLEDDEQIKDLAHCPKEQAEHVMLVDLMRNDLNCIAESGSVTVTEDRSIEFYSHVMHLVSEVSGQTKSFLADMFKAIFPGGTITGAPKESVMATIAELEQIPRGPYTGSLGYISSGFGIDFNILIRSVFMKNNQACIHTGAGIVIDSDAKNEWLEIERKAMAIKDILRKRAIPKAKRAMIKGPKLASPNFFVKDTRQILFVENRDSFSFNIIDALKTLGALVHLTEKPKNIPADISHVVIGPGPGNPVNLPVLKEIIAQTLSARLPLLGICLGHQAIGHYFGAAIKKAEPVHGKSHQIIHQGQGLFQGLSSPANFVRYHSLVIAQAPENFVVDAYCQDDTIMAIRHHTRPIFGVQFHPESYLSIEGHMILSNFLENYSL
jgi:anthranilate synthase